MVHKRWKVLGLSCVGALLVAELFVRISHFVRGKVPPSLDQAQELEWQWAFDNQKFGGPTDLSITFHPRLGFVNVPDLALPDVRTNSMGFRADKEFTRERIPGVARILLVGDSYTFGYPLSNEVAWAEVLRRDYLPDHEVLNLGVSAYGVDQALLMYELIGAEYEADVVVLTIFARDYVRNLSGFHRYLKPRFELLASGELELVDDELIPAEELYEAYRSGERKIGRGLQSYFLTKITAKTRYWIDCVTLDRDSDAFMIMARILRRFRDVVHEQGARPFLLFIPEELEKHLGTHWETMDHLVMEEARALGLPALSVTEDFIREERAHPDAPLNPAHLSVRGNEFVAELLHAALLEAALLPSTSKRSLGGG